MKQCNDIQRLMHDVLADSAAQGGRRRLEEHIASCDACRREWALLERITTAPGHRPDPGPQFWDGFEDRLSRRMEQEQRHAVRTAPHMHLVSRRVVQVAAAIALVALGVLLGRSTLSGDAPLLPDPSNSKLVALDAQAFSVLDRSRTLLLDVANFDANQDLPSDLNLERRQQAATTLVREAADIRSQLSESDRQRMMNLLSDLEIILLQLAHLDAEVDLPQIEMMQQGIDRKAILFKIDIESMNREEQQTRDSAAEPSPRSQRSAI